ncbi:MAG: hypothetical protein FWD97_02965 [Defluviitaleaceae bacterium]|nr:hypothetical protein [Defluviitaleaceae bacterium]
MSVSALKDRLGNRTQGMGMGKGIGKGIHELQGASNLQGASSMQGAGGLHNIQANSLASSTSIPTTPTPNISTPTTSTPNPNLSTPNPNANPSNPVSDSDGLNNIATGDVMPDAGGQHINPNTINPNNNSAITANHNDNLNTINPNTTETGLGAAQQSGTTGVGAVIESNYLALANTNAINIITENLKNQPLSYQLFDVVKAPTGGATVFTVPGLTGDEIAKELTGIILDYTTPRAYWSTPEPVEGTPPNCYSPDSIVSVDGKPCSTCLYNTFGSKGMNGAGIKGLNGIGSNEYGNGHTKSGVNGSVGNGVSSSGVNSNSGGISNGKACKESIQALLLLPDSVIPIIVRIPVTSKVIFQKYMTRLVSRMIPLNSVVTKITLEKATSNGGQPYAKFNFEAVEVLSPEEASHARAYGQTFSDMLSATHDAYDVDGVYEGSGYQEGYGGDVHNADVHSSHDGVNFNIPHNIHADPSSHQFQGIHNPPAPQGIQNV